MVVRLQTNGMLDPTFGPNGNGSVAIPFDLGGTNRDEARDVVVQADGRIVVVGLATRAVGNTDIAVARLTANGFLDGTFGDGVSGTGRTVIRVDQGPAGQQQDVGRGVALQGNSILITGSVQRSNVDADFLLARLTPAGRQDGTFSNGTDGIVLVDFAGGFDAARKLVVQPDGRLVMVGEAQISGQADFAIVRLTDDGKHFDYSFSGDGKLNIDFRLGGSNNDIGRDIALTPDGGIVVVGEADTSQGQDFAIAQLTASGDLDGTFSSDGRLTVDFNRGGQGGISNMDSASAVVVQNDGKIVVGGKASSTASGTEFALFRTAGLPIGGGGFDLGKLFEVPPDPGLPTIPAARNVTPLVSIVRVRMRKRGKARYLIRIRNASGADLSSLILIIDGLRRASRLRLRGAAGLTLNEPPINSPFQIVNAPGGILRSGEETEVMVSFANPLGVNVRFSERVMSGSPDLL